MMTPDFHPSMQSFAQIYPRLFVSGCIRATDMDILKTNNIGLVVNCTKHVGFVFQKANESTQDPHFSTFDLNSMIDGQPCYFDSQNTKHPHTFLMRRVRLPVEDNLRLDELIFMAKCLPSIVQLIHEYIQEQENKEKKNVLIHCVAGQQRSACVAAAYLMKYHDMKMNQAIEYMRQQKNDAFQTGVNFAPSLIDFYEKHVQKNISL